MKLALQIAAGIFLGLFAFLVVFGYLANRAADEAMADWTRQMQKLTAQPLPSRKLVAAPVPAPSVQSSLDSFQQVLLDSNERLRINAQHQRMPVQFSRSGSGEKLKYGQECVSGTILDRSLQNGVPTAVQLRENNRLVGCQGDHRL